MKAKPDADRNGVLLRSIAEHEKARRRARIFSCLVILVAGAGVLAFVALVSLTLAR